MHCFCCLQIFTNVSTLWFWKICLSLFNTRISNYGNYPILQIKKLYYESVMWLCSNGYSEILILASLIKKLYHTSCLTLLRSSSQVYRLNPITDSTSSKIQRPTFYTVCITIVNVPMVAEKWLTFNACLEKFMVQLSTTHI